MVAAAVVGAAVVGAAGSAYAGSEEASATKNATNASITAQQQALSQQEALEAPYNAIGTDAKTTYENLLGIGSGSGSANTATMESTLANTPGYQFALNQGLTSTKNAATASGLSMSGNTLQALDQYSTGLADSTYETELGNYAGAVGIGQAAASGTAANIGTTASNVSNALTTQGTNTANIDANTIAGITKATGNAANQYTTQQTLADIYGSTGVGNGALGAGTTNSLAGINTSTSGYGNIGGYYVNSDAGLKKNIEPYRFNGMSGLQVYDFHYRHQRNSERKHRGYIAQEVLKKYPNAVKRNDQGFLMINYAKLPGWDELDAMIRDAH